VANSPRRPDKNLAKNNLYAGKLMAQDEFHRAYDGMPECYRAELIAGVVHEPSPLGLPHGKMHPRLSSILDRYMINTPGVEIADNVTVILSNKDEVQPDVLLRILPDYGGQSQNVQLASLRTQSKVPYVKGAPELVAEIAHSSRDIDLHAKKDRYALAGVCEYIIVCLQPEQIYWFYLRSGQQLIADRDGIFRSIIFPGLWIHGSALLKLDGDRSMSALDEGLASHDHSQFVLKLATRRKDY
jgi:Putative restriction endonuclease